MKLKRISWLAALLLCLPLGAQEQTRGGIPADVYYLMPSFGQGMIYFRGQLPAQGQLNICALDQTLRFLDKSGKELAASNMENILKVQIDTVSFLRFEDAFYRLYPVAADMGVAVMREVKIQANVKQGAYGTTSQTSAIKERSTMYVDGAVYNLTDDKPVAYETSEWLYLYKADEIFPLNKKNLKKLFPARKDQIDAYFKAGNKVPGTVGEVVELIRRWE